MHCCPGKSALKETVSKQRAPKRKYSPVSASTKHVQPAQAHQDVQGSERCISLDGFVHLYLKQITLLIHFQNMVFKPLFKARKLRFPLSLQFISSPENSWVTAAPHTDCPGRHTVGLSSVGIARHDLYMKILRLFSKNFSWPKQFCYSLCKFMSCSCLVRCIINCLHPPSHPSPTTTQHNCQIRFIAIKL